MPKNRNHQNPDQKQQKAKNSGNRHKIQRNLHQTEPYRQPKDTNLQPIKRCENSANSNSHNYTPSTSSTSSEKGSAETDILEIPGFYYDKEKKKYFKILPGHHASESSSVITKDSIHKKQKEDERKINLKKFSIPSKDYLKLRTKSSSSRLKGSSHAPCNIKREVNVGNIYSFVDLSRFGAIPALKSKYKASRTVVCNLNPFTSRKIFKSPSNSYERLEHMHKMYATQTNPNHIVCLWSLKDILVQRLQTICIDSVDKSKEDLAGINLKVTGAMIPKAFSKVTSMCSAVFKNQEEGNEHVLYTTMCVIGNNPSLAMLRNLNCTGSRDFRVTEFNLSSKATWCSAWNPVSSQFSVGTEKSGLLLDVETRRLWELNSDNSDVLCQTFTQNGDLLYSGTRKGNICCHDLRSRSTYPTSRIFHKSPVCHVHMSEDGCCLTAADFSGQIKRWDLRQRKVILQYKGHNNSYSVIPFHVNNDLGILYAAGQDCYTRIWDLNDGHILRTIPPPYPADINNIPTLCYSSHMGKYSSRPGLLMGILDEIHFYSL